MSVKLAILKSGEDIVADIKEMLVGEGDDAKVVGYFLTKPCTIRMRDHQEVVDEEVTEEKQKSQFQVKFYPWIPLAKDPIIPLTTEWVVTMVEPVDNLTKMFKDQVLKYGKDNQSNSTDQSSVSDK